MNTEEELEGIVGFLNEKIFRYPQRLRLEIKNRPDLGGVLAFMVLSEEPVVVPVPPITICWCGGEDVRSACEIMLRKFSAGSDLLRKYLPFTAGSLEELKLKATAYYG